MRVQRCLRLKYYTYYTYTILKYYTVQNIGIFKITLKNKRSIILFKRLIALKWFMSIFNQTSPEHFVDIVSKINFTKKDFRPLISTKKISNNQKQSDI